MTNDISTEPNVGVAAQSPPQPKKWYKLKPDVLKTHDPMLTLLGLLFEFLNVKMEEKKLRTLSPVLQYLFEETNAPNALTKKTENVRLN